MDQQEAGDSPPAYPDIVLTCYFDSPPPYLFSPATPDVPPPAYDPPTLAEPEVPLPQQFDWEDQQVCNII